MDIRFDEQGKKIKMREDRKNEILDAVRVLAVPNKDLAFVVDPQCVEDVKPFLIESEELRAANAAARSAMSRARGIYEKLAGEGIVSGDSGEPVHDIESQINSRKNRHAQALEELRQLQSIDPETCKPIVPPEKRARAYELTDEIKSIPKQVEILQTALAECRKLFENLSNPPVLSRGFGDLPTREGVRKGSKAASLAKLSSHEGVNIEED